MATALANPPITVKQYLGFEGYPGLRDELINGKIVLSPQPKPQHQQVVKNLFLVLDKALQSSDLTVQMNSNIRFDDSHSMPAPDLFVVRHEVWRRVIEEDRYLSEPPLLVAEVISPANRSKKVQDKIEIYLAHGVQHVLVIYPKKLSVSLARKTGKAVQLERVERVQITAHLNVDFPASDLFAVA